MSRLPLISDVRSEDCSGCGSYQTAEISFACDTCSGLLCEHCEKFFIFQCEACNIILCKCRQFVNEESYPTICNTCGTETEKVPRTKNIKDHSPCLGPECKGNEDCKKKTNWRIVYKKSVPGLNDSDLSFMKATKWRMESKNFKKLWTEDRICEQCYDTLFTIEIPNNLPKPNFEQKKQLSPPPATPLGAPMKNRRLNVDSSALSQTILFP